MTCAPLSLWRAEESGFSKSESGSDDHGETFVVALSDSTFIEAVLLNGALICARILFVETLAANNAMPSRAILATNVAANIIDVPLETLYATSHKWGIPKFSFLGDRQRGRTPIRGKSLFLRGPINSGVLKHESDFDGHLAEHTHDCRDVATVHRVARLLRIVPFFAVGNLAIESSAANKKGRYTGKVCYRETPTMDFNY